MTTQNSKNRPSSSRTLTRNVVIDFLGMTAPLLVGIIAIPLLIETLGVDRFGLLSIIWMGVGYFTVFDMGLARALTKLVASQIGLDDQRELGPIVWSALAAILGLGLVATLAVATGSRTISESLLRVAPELQGEAVDALRILALGIPAVLLTTALIGLLQARQRFAAINLVRVPLGTLTFIGPLISAHFSPSLAWATLSLVAARFLALALYAMIAATAFPECTPPSAPRLQHVRSLFRFGGWLTLTNLVGPIMVYFDRFIIGGILSMAAVTYYVTPYEVITRLRSIPGSFAAVLFPAFATGFASDGRKTVRLYRDSDRTLLFIMLPITVAVFLFGPEALGYWAGLDFQENGTWVVRWLALGLFMNIYAHMPFIALQSSGRPDLTAKLHLAELLPYLAILFAFAKSFGISGVALAWFLRTSIDALALRALVAKQIPALAGVQKQDLAFLSVVPVALMMTGWQIDSPATKGAILILISLVSISSLQQIASQNRARSSRD